ncbi:MAG TPA: magnesium transporter [Clostridia bacterium]|nr:magnesium transporter [Clostridia bacterium]
MDFTRMQELLQSRQYSLLKKELSKEQNVDIAEFLDELDARCTLLVFRLLPKEIAADVFSHLSAESQAQLSVLVNEQELRDILDDLKFDDKIDFLEEVPANVVKRILKHSTETERKLINKFLNYPEDSAGSLMAIEFVELKKEMLVSDALVKIRQGAPGKETIYICYVTDKSRHLEGVLSLRELVIASPEQKIEEIMNREVIYVHTLDDKEDVADLIQKYDLLALPVTDNENRLVGIITVDDIVDVIEEESTEDIHKMATVGKLDVNLLDASPFLLVRKRLPWLLVLIFINVFSGAFIAYYEATIQAVIALVFFLPLLIDSAGNAGSQSATLMIRALTVGDVELRDWFKLFRKEFIISLVLGIFMGLAVSVIGIFRGGIDVAIVVSLTMLVIVLVGSMLGMSLPFLFSKFKIDPAVASGPLVTSIADIAGVLIYFSIASWYLGIQ